MGLDMQALFAMANKTAAAGGKGAGISKKIAGLEGAYNKAEGVYNKAKEWDADGDGLEFADIARGGLAAAGSAGGMILGNMLLPGVGGMIGSTVLGGIGGGIGKLIGGDTKAEKAAKEEAEKAENDARRKAKAEKQARDAQAMQPQGVMSSVEVPQIDVINTEYRDDPNEYSGGGEQLSDEQYKEILGSALAVCDRRLKWVDHKHTLRYIRGMDALSDEDCKDIMSMVDPKQLAYELLEEGPPYSASDLRFLHDLMLEDGGEDYKYNIKYGSVWKDDVLDGYADHIRNYYYKYKPEAQGIDPDIDPEEDQCGPMAQDIEQVNPSVVSEVNGAKVVDTKKLALMNAGVIAELARRMKDLEGV